MKIRSKVERLLKKGLTIEEIAKRLNLPLGSRYTKKSAKWYKYCIIAKRNQKIAIKNTRISIVGQAKFPNKNTLG